MKSASMLSMRIRPVLLIALLASGVAHAQGGPSGVIGLNEEEARFVPGSTTSTKGPLEPVVEGAPADPPAQ